MNFKKSEKGKHVVGVKFYGPIKMFHTNKISWHNIKHAIHLVKEVKV